MIHQGQYKKGVFTVKKFKLTSVFLALVLLLAACSGSNESTEDASGTSFPDKPLELIVPYAAGGGTDSLARSFADQAESSLGESVAVVNREGGGGAVGMQNGISADPDGYTVSMVTVELLTLPHSGLAQFSYEEFQPIALLNEDPAAITVPADAPYDTIEEFIEASKSEKFKLGTLEQELFGT